MVDDLTNGLIVATSAALIIESSPMELARPAIWRQTQSQRPLHVYLLRLTAAIICRVGIALLSIYKLAIHGLAAR